MVRRRLYSCLGCVEQNKALRRGLEEEVNAAQADEEIHARSGATWQRLGLDQAGKKSREN